MAEAFCGTKLKAATSLLVEPLTMDNGVSSRSLCQAGYLPCQMGQFRLLAFPDNQS